MLKKEELSQSILGSLVGEAIGDALGYPVEFTTQTPAHRTVFDLATRDGVALYSDDTQMTIAVAKGLLKGRNFSDRTVGVAEQLVEWSVDPPGGHRAPGGACMAGCAALRAGTTWNLAGRVESGGGCGAAMRSAPYGWLHADPNDAAREAAEHAQMTHRHPIGLASAAATAAAVSAAVSTYVANVVLPGEEWTIAQRALFAAEEYDQTTARMIAYAMWLATIEGQMMGDDYVLNLFRGWAGHEAIAASIYCFLRHPYCYEDAVLLAVNSPGDSDSLGAITGAISGAFLGINEIPTRWIEKIERKQGLYDLAGRFTEMLCGEENTIPEPPPKGE